MLKYLLIPLGILAGIILAAPQLVIVGYLFLIIPGLILTAIPTVFVYLLAVFLIRCALPMEPGIKATMTSAGLAIAIGFAVMLPWRMAEIQRYEIAAHPDRVSAEELALSGNVLLDFSQDRTRSRGQVKCDHLCIALLDTPGVKSVTRVSGKGSATYRLGAVAPGRLVLPVRPQEIFRAFDRLSPGTRVQNSQQWKECNQALLADWALRIAQGEELKEDETLAEDQIDWHISYQDVSQHGQPRVRRLEIRDGDGNVKRRMSLVEHRVPAPIFYFGFDAGSAVDSFRGAKFTIGGSVYSNQESGYRIDPEVELLRLTRIPMPNPDVNAIAHLESQLLEALDNPQATDAQLLLAPMWLSQFQYDACEKQLDTIAKILLNQRIDDPHEQLRQALRSRTDLTKLRDGLAIRFLNANEPRAQRWYVSALVDLPQATFAQPSRFEQEIWSRAITDDEAARFLGAFG